MGRATWAAMRTPSLWPMRTSRTSESRPCEGALRCAVAPMRLHRAVSPLSLFPRALTICCSCHSRMQYTAPKSVTSHIPVDDGNEVPPPPFCHQSSVRKACVRWATLIRTRSRAVFLSLIDSDFYHVQDAFGRPQRITDREDDYRKRRLARALSPARNDAFAMGDQTPDARVRTYADVMKDQQLAREKDNTLQVSDQPPLDFALCMFWQGPAFPAPLRGNRST